MFLLEFSYSSMVIICKKVFYAAVQLPGKPIPIRWVSALSALKLPFEETVELDSLFHS
jgi:hypothetical protein